MNIGTITAYVIVFGAGFFSLVSGWWWFGLIVLALVIFRPARMLIGIPFAWIVGAILGPLIGITSRQGNNEITEISKALGIDRRVIEHALARKLIYSKEVELLAAQYDSRNKLIASLMPDLITGLQILDHENDHISEINDALEALRNWCINHGEAFSG